MRYINSLLTLTLTLTIRLNTVGYQNNLDEIKINCKFINSLSYSAKKD